MLALKLTPTLVHPVTDWLGAHARCLCGTRVSECEQQSRAMMSECAFKCSWISFTVTQMMQQINSCVHPALRAAHALRRTNLRVNTPPYMHEPASERGAVMDAGGMKNAAVSLKTHIYVTLA